MSMLADIVGIFKDAHNKGLSKYECAELLVDVVGALEWEPFDVDVDSEDWLVEEMNQAYRLLWGDE